MTERPDTNLYAVLGVASKASDTELDHAFRALARRLHPDMNHHDNTDADANVDADADGAAFQRVLAAYAVLRDPVARRDYDRRQTPATEPFHPSAAAPQTPATPTSTQGAEDTASAEATAGAAGSAWVEGAQTTSKLAAARPTGSAWSPDPVIWVDPPQEPALRIGPVHHRVAEPDP